MDKKKSETVDCPVHHQPIEVIRDGKRRYALCTCDVPNNPYSGRPVWEKFPDPDEPKSGE
jgi:hypothetical protein